MPAAGMNAVAWRLPSVMVPVLSSSSTSTSPAASTARPDMAMTFFWIMRSMPAMPMAESSPPMVVGMRLTSRATSTVSVMGVPCPATVHAEDGERQQRDGDDQENERQRGEENVQRDLVRRLLPLGRLDEVDHPVEKRLARVGGHPDNEPVGEHAGAAGHGAPVAAGLADHGGALAGDRRFRRPSRRLGRSRRPRESSLWPPR